jgi:hypothetical protein
MKKSMILLAGILIAIGVLTSCATEEYDVEKALHGTWLCRPTARDISYDNWMIMTDDTFELDIYLTGAEDIPTNLQVKSSQGAMEAHGGTGTATTYYNHDGAAWQIQSPPNVGGFSYTLDGDRLTITADWDGPDVNPPSPEVFIKQY